MWSSKLAICGLLVLAWAQAQEEVEVTTGQGSLKGVKMDTVYHKKPYYSFRGIPFAKPRVGQDRFRDPEPAENWSGVYDATKFSPSCPFYCMIKQDLIGSEDCLYLNVFTPDINPDARKAVMVFIYGAGWQGGLAEDLFYGPDFLVEEDVILVTFNHRLGALGFLNTGDENASGNMGMKDQVMALRWVKDNIRYFGGCPNRVTIFGESSGAASVEYHMISPMSQGLFNGVIAQSGSVMNPWSTNENLKEVSFELGQIVGIRTSDTKELVDKLRDVPLKDIVMGANDVSMNKNIVDGHLFQFVPSVEANVGQEIFLPTHPWELMKTGAIADVPMMLGMIAKESLFLALGMVGQAEQVTDNYELFVPSQMNVSNPIEKRQIGEMIKKYYLGDKKISATPIPEEYYTMVDDQLVVSGQAMSLKILGARKSTPIYLYVFSYESSRGLFKNIYGLTEGLAHGDELTYQFYSKYAQNLPQPGSSDEKMTRIMTKLWTNFAKDNDPTSVMDDDITTKWVPRGANNNYMNINQDLKMESDLYKDRIAFWAGLYKDLLGDFA